MTEKRYDGSTYEETIIKLLVLIANHKYGNYDRNQREYLHRLEKELF